MSNEDATKEILLKHLEILNQKISEVTGEINQIRGQFLFGGIIAVIALLNTDLLVENRLATIPQEQKLGMTLLLGAFALIISAVYFYIIAERLQYLQKTYRSAKEKYELTLYALLMSYPTQQFPYKKYLAALENRQTPDLTDFDTTMNYLVNHHNTKLKNLSLRRDWLTGFLIVLLAVVIKFAMLNFI